jgi:Leu/Phe-tRNA-protein transferase
MRKAYPLRYTQSGMIFMGPEDDCDGVVDEMLESGYSEEFCVALDWNPAFIADLMYAGFLVMSTRLEEDSDGPAQTLVLPKLHLERSALFFGNLHIKKSIRRFLPRYELRFDEDYGAIVGNCVKAWGPGWVTPELVRAFALIRKATEGVPWGMCPPRPVCFGAYREGRLVAGEFGVRCGRVYTSYSGYHDEPDSGTAQMILMIKWLEENGFAFLDFGMPLDYKTELGAVNISPAEFVRRFRGGRNC